MLNTEPSLVTFVKDNKYSAFIFHLDHKNLFSWAIQNVLDMGQSFGHNKHHVDESVMLNPAEFNRDLDKQNDSGVTTDMLRSIIVVQHLWNVLVANGYAVEYMRYSGLSTELAELMELLSVDIPFNSELQLDSTQNLMDTAKNSQYVKTSDLPHTFDRKQRHDTCDHCADSTQPGAVAEPGDSMLCSSVNVKTASTPSAIAASSCGSEGLQIDSRTKQDSVILDVKTFMEEKNIPQGKGKFDKNIDIVEVTVNGHPSRHFKQMVLLESQLKSFTEMGLLSAKVDLLWRMVSVPARHRSQLHLTIGPVISKNTCDEKEESSANDIFQSRYRQMEDASVMKHGDDVYHGSGWEDTIMSLTVASIKFEFLHLTCRNALKIDSSGGDTRLGSFVMYNYARLSTLFTHFQEAVDDGTYPPLPAVEEVDFSTLKGEGEWSLLYDYILTFPDVVSDSVEELVSNSGDIHPRIHTHKICNFLIGLSRNISSYYSKTHILGECLPHLFPVMFARLFLMKATHQVMRNAFALMGIKPLTHL
ncbi:hypothetical protein ScPMuIL_008835 [Solemya velum]